jgi:hypothetical protein
LGDFEGAQADNRANGRRIFDEGDQSRGIMMRSTGTRGIAGAENANGRASGLADGDGVERWREDAGRKMSIRNCKAGMGSGKLMLSKVLQP